MEFSPLKKLEKTKKLEKIVRQKRVAEPVGGWSIHSRVASSPMLPAFVSGDPEPLQMDDFRIVSVSLPVALAFKELAPSSLSTLASHQIIGSSPEEVPVKTTGTSGQCQSDWS